MQEALDRQEHDKDKTITKHSILDYMFYSTFLVSVLTEEFNLKYCFYIAIIN